MSVRRTWLLYSVYLGADLICWSAVALSAVSKLPLASCMDACPIAVPGKSFAQ